MLQGENMAKPVCKAKTTKRRRQSKERSGKLSAAEVARREEERRLVLQREQHALVDQYYPFATSIAKRVAKSLASSVDYDDILCNARLGLLEAAQRYDASHEVDFRTFAYYRIRGAIYDGLRKSGWLPRSLYAKMKFEEAANDYLHQQAVDHGRSADSREMATSTINNLASIYVISLDANEGVEVADPNQVDVEGRTAMKQVRGIMRSAIGKLPLKEKQLIMMYYFQNRTLEEAGKRMGLSKSWTSRLHARALGMLLSNVERLTGEGEDQSKDEGNPKEGVIANGN